MARLDSSRKYFWISLFSVIGLFIVSCGVNSNVMFKEAKGEKVLVNSDSIPLKPREPYRIGIDDKITFTLSTNNGNKIIENIAGVADGQGAIKGNVIEYLVRQNGEVELPVVGKVHVANLTIEECEDTLKERFSTYQNPFIQVKVTNQRAIVFPGEGSDARVVSLDNSNTTLMEVIALSGGITDRGKANSIKIMRRLGDSREVYRIDLSTMDGLAYADMIIQANDYIYIEPTPELAKELSEDIVPVVSLISSGFFIFAAIISLK